ncbi:MAG TPA: glycosyltransferase family 4 protein [Thermoleophilaceae bacterium]
MDQPTRGNSAGPRRRLMIYSDALNVGGAEVSVGHLIAELPERFEVTIAGVQPDVVQSIAARRPGTNVEVLDRVRDKLDVVAIADHVRLLRRARPDILHVNLFTPWSGQYAQLAGVATPGVRTVAVEHLPMPATHRRQRFAKRALSRAVSAHVAVGERSAREIEQLVGLPTESIMTIYNGVPQNAPPPLERRADGPVVGSVGRLSEQKGYDLLVRALPDLPDAQLVLVGDGPERARLESLARELGVSERLRITGWSDKVSSHLAYFDVFALPSRYEAFPLAILEAMFAAVPVVAAEVGSVPEAVQPGVTGLTVAPGSASELASAIRSLLADPERARELGRNARRMALDRFSVRAMTDRYIALYDRLAG